MLKKLLIGAALLSASAASHAGFVDQITGADMAGIEITATFSDNSVETGTWLTSSLPNTGGFAGQGFSSSLAGPTFGSGGATGPVEGEWIVDNYNTADLVSITIDAGIAGIYFDTLESIEYTPGSNVGRPYFGSDASVMATFSNQLDAAQPDLFGTLTLNWAQGAGLAAGDSFSFVTDTDKATVSEPATALVFLTGLLALASRRKKA